jgi:hypothetical protein
MGSRRTASDRKKMGWKKPNVRRIKKNNENLTKYLKENRKVYLKASFTPMGLYITPS